MTGTEVGIAAFGAYVPSLRVDRAEIAAAHAWVNPGLGRVARGERSSCGWDEDAITMAVEAGRGALANIDRERIKSLAFASTTAPFADRLNAGVVSGALRLHERCTALDLGGSLRAGTSALLAAADAAAASDDLALCIAADRRSAAPATTQELTFGHAAAALVVGPGSGLARMLARTSLTVDFVDHYRSAGQSFDYVWEERWVREEGYQKLVLKLVRDAIERAGLRAADITHFCMPAAIRGVDRLVAKAAGFRQDAVGDQLADGCGDSGTAHPLLMLVNALESAQPGDTILVASFAQGGDAVVFEVEEAITEYREQSSGVGTWIRNGTACPYPRYLTLNGLLDVDYGMRAEADRGTGLSAAWRHDDLILGLIGGRCTACGTHQIPRARLCVNPECRALDTQVPHSFADSVGIVVSWSADHLIFTPDPPAVYGLVDFPEGGRLMMDFVVDDRSPVDIGTPMRMIFRIKDHDVVRHYRRYFWKATPIAQGDG
jgi:hydroxymethylglutaryl-CoA synthase